MHDTVLSFEEKTQTFSLNIDRLQSFDFRNIALEQLFNENNSYFIMKHFIAKDVAIRIRDFYSLTDNSKSFIQPDNESSHRIYYYNNSPYRYPKFIVSLLEHCMVIKNRLFFFHDFYQIYCMINKINPRSYKEVTRLQNLHSWSSVYWYKNGNSFYRHIDSFGDLACFLILTKKGEDYNNGGLVVEQGCNSIDVDEFYDYGDLVFFDQSKVFHSVSAVKTHGKQVGRMQLVIPTITQNYMQKQFNFEGHRYTPFFTDDNISYSKKISLWVRNIINKNDIHYSRKEFKHYQNII